MECSWASLGERCASRHDRVCLPFLFLVCNALDASRLEQVDSLYGGYVVRHRDEIVSKTGAGLFLHGGNPIYYTAKGTSDDVASEIQVYMQLLCFMKSCFSIYAQFSA